MPEADVSLTAARRVLKKKTMATVISDHRVTSHGLKILERWAQNEPPALRRLERNLDTFMAVLLQQQEWEPPSSAERIEEQLRNGLTRHELCELGAPDLSCSHAMWRMDIA
ncbi:hypothetical protein C4J81_04280 [Deltaproteobacteria bacterium Smac51]|nr:hypothetical protein C4J81_04280 [Deltaproteobacteria bacterium Smac51]